MTREPSVTIVDREGAMLELKRLARILWAVHNRGAASQEDFTGVHDILLGLETLARRHLTPLDMVDAVYAVTHDLEFSLSTVRTLCPDLVTATHRSGLQ